MQLSLIKKPDNLGTIDHLPQNHPYVAILAHRATGLILKAFTSVSAGTCKWLMDMDGEQLQAFYFFEVAPTPEQARKIQAYAINPNKLARLLNRKASKGFGGAV